MKRFENAQVGDEVYCRLHGEGIIKSTTSSAYNYLKKHGVL